MENFSKKIIEHPQFVSNFLLPISCFGYLLKLRKADKEALASIQQNSSKTWIPVYAGMTRLNIFRKKHHSA